MVTMGQGVDESTRGVTTAGEAASATALDQLGLLNSVVTVTEALKPFSYGMTGVQQDLSRTEPFLYTVTGQFKDLGLAAILAGAQVAGAFASNAPGAGKSGDIAGLLGNLPGSNSTNNTGGMTEEQVWLQ